MNKSFIEELDADKTLVKRFRKRQEVLNSCERLGLAAKQQRHAIIRPTFESLKEAYQAQSTILNRTYPQCCIKTEAEKIIAYEISRATNLIFFGSFWIINRNIDLFCPAIGNLYPPILKGKEITRASQMRGFVVEVDGSIHDRELKMKKDTSKYRFLHDLGIGLTVIENQDVHGRQVQNLITQLKTIPRLDSRARERLLRKIYVSTLAYHANDETMSRLYGPSFIQLTSEGQERTACHE